MAATGTPDITLARDGRFFIDKRYRGIRIGMRADATSIDQVEQRLDAEMRRIDIELARAQRRRPCFASFIAERLSAGVAATTINRSLEVVRTILYRAARSYRDDDGRPWLDALAEV